MNILKNLLLFNKKPEIKEGLNQRIIEQYEEIANLVKEARIKRNLTIQDLSKISKIPEITINSIENNNPKYIPKYPYIRSILIKLEQCLYLKKNTLVNLAIKKVEVYKREKQNFIFRKIDLINTWQGILLYFFILILTIFFLKRYFILNVNIIEIQNTENEFIEK